MALARVLVRKELRARWRGLILLGLLAAVWAAVAMTAIAGARRTASVVDRFQRVTAASDAQFVIEGDDTAAELLESLRAAPEVSAVDSLWSASSGFGFDRGLWVNLVVGIENVWGQEFDRPIVVRGRLADPSNPTEVMISPEVVDFFDVDVGDRMALPMWDHDEWEAWMQTRGKYPEFNGPLLEVVVVGVVERAEGLGSAAGDALLISATPALFERWGAEIGANNRYIPVTFHDRDFDPAILAQRLTDSLGVPVNVSSDEEMYAGNLRDSTRALTMGLVVLAIAVLVAGGLVLGLAVAREVRRASTPYEALRALGATPRQRISVLTTPIAIAGIAAAAIAIVTAGFASALFPLGSARAAEPNRGVWLDAPVLAGGSLVAVFMVVISVACQLRPVRAVSRSSTHTGWRPSFLRNLGPTALVGVVNAVGSRRARASIVVAVVTITALSAAAWFERSMDDLGKSPDKWGYTWSSSPEFNVAGGSQSDELLRQLAANNDVGSVSVLNTTVIGVDGEPVGLSTIVGYDSELIEPVVLAGRLPTSTFEIAVGEATAERLKVGIGDQVRIDSPFAPSLDCIVVGVVVPPYRGTGADVGAGIYTNAMTFARLDHPFDTIVAVLLIEYEPGVDAQAVEADLTDLGFRFEARSRPRQPRAIANIVGALVVVRWLLVFFVVQGLLATLLAAARRGTARSRDRVILRTLGFSRNDTLRATAIETVTIIAIALVVGVSLGLLAGYQAWHLTTADLGVVDSMSSALLVVVGIAGLAIFGAGGLSLTVSRAVADRGSSFRNPQN
ncbi:MAG: ABC transporter permease [Ilumatobacteraceae bacterium]